MNDKTAEMNKKKENDDVTTKYAYALSTMAAAYYHYCVMNYTEKQVVNYLNSKHDQISELCKKYNCGYVWDKAMIKKVMEQIGAERKGCSFFYKGKKIE